MIKPGLFAVLSPIVAGLFFKHLVTLLGHELLGAKVDLFNLSVFILTLCFGRPLAFWWPFTWITQGEAWNNSNKYVKSWVIGGKGSNLHKAAICGDTVGDPFKDTAGSSIHILIKILSTITIVIAPIFIEWYYFNSKVIINYYIFFL